MLRAHTSTTGRPAKNASLAPAAFGAGVALEPSYVAYAQPSRTSAPTHFGTGRPPVLRQSRVRWVDAAILTEPDQRLDEGLWVAAPCGWVQAVSPGHVRLIPKSKQVRWRNMLARPLEYYMRVGGTLRKAPAPAPLEPAASVLVTGSHSVAHTAGCCWLLVGRDAEGDVDYVLPIASADEGVFLCPEPVGGAEEWRFVAHHQHQQNVAAGGAAVRGDAASDDRLSSVSSSSSSASSTAGSASSMPPAGERTAAAVEAVRKHARAAEMPSIKEADVYFVLSTRRVAQNAEAPTGFAWPTPLAGRACHVAVWTRNFLFAVSEAGQLSKHSVSASRLRIAAASGPNEVRLLRVGAAPATVNLSEVVKSAIGLALRLYSDGGSRAYMDCDLSVAIAAATLRLDTLPSLPPDAFDRAPAFEEL